MIYDWDSSLDDIDWTDPVNYDHDLNRGLVEWWLAVPDTRGFGSVQWRGLCNRHVGTLTNMTPATAWKGASRPGGWGAVAFPGTNGNVDIGTSTAFNTLTFSASFAFLQTTAGTQYIWDCYNVAANAGWGIKITSGGILQLETHASGFATVGTTGSYNDGKWHFATLTCSGSGGTQQWYVDGKADGSGSLAIAASTESKSFGGPISVDYIGLLDNLTFFNRVISGTEASQLNQCDKQFHPGLLNRVPSWYYGPVAAAGGGTILPQIMQHGLFVGSNA